MSKPTPKIRPTRPTPPDYTGGWNHARFLAACEDAGIDPDSRSADRRLAELVNAYRSARGCNEVAKRAAAGRWLKGERDPSKGASGQRPSAYDLAGALGVSLDWLLSGVRS